MDSAGAEVYWGLAGFSLRPPLPAKLTLKLPICCHAMTDTVDSSLPASILHGCCFETDRLLVQEFKPTFARWHSAAESKEHEFDVASVVVASLLTEEAHSPTAKKSSRPNRSRNKSRV